MAECIILKGGGGADLDMVTAESFDVLAGKVFVDKNGEPLPGTLTLSGDVSNDQVLAGRSYYSTDPKNKQTGSMPNYSTTPTAIDAIRINNNRFEVAVARGFHGYNWAGGGYEYMSYDQVANAIGLTPAKLKKGEWVCGRTGTFEGYVPTATDLYLRGNNIAGLMRQDGTAGFDAGQITIGSRLTLRIIFNMTGFTRLNIEGYSGGASNTIKELRLSTAANGGGDLGYINLTGRGPGNYTAYFDVSNQQRNGTFYMNFYQLDNAVYRIWLS